MLKNTLGDEACVNCGHRLGYPIHPIEETKMFKNRFILVLGVLSLLLVTMAVSQPFSNAPTAEELSWPPRPVIVSGVDNTLLSDYYERQAELNPSAGSEDAANLANDFYQRHTDWASGLNIGVPVTGISESLDYFQRHPELSMPVEAGAAIDMTDYFVRHPELHAPIENTDLSDYFLRH